MKNMPSQNMKESKDRTEQFMHSTSAAASQAPPSTRPFYSCMFACPDKSQGSLLYGNSQRSDPMGDGSTFGASRFDSKGKGRATPQNGDILALDLGSAEEGTASQNGDAFMQMQLVEQQVRSQSFPAGLNS